MISNQQAIRGAEKAAIIMLAAGESHSVDLFSRLAESEIKEISDAMAGMSHVKAAVVETVLNEFASQAPVVDARADLAPNAPVREPTRTDFRNYAGQYTDSGSEVDVAEAQTSSVWEDLDKVDPDRLARYLENEHPQTAAVVLARLDRAQAASVLSKFHEAFTADVVDRMLSADGVKDEILASLEQTLRREFVGPDGASTSNQDSLNTDVELLERLDPATEHKFLETLSHRNQSALMRLRGRRFVFAELEQLSGDDMARVAPTLNPSKLALALKGASDPLRDKVLAAFPKRMGVAIEAEMASLGPVRLRDVDAAQAEVADSARKALSRPVEPTRIVA